MASNSVYFNTISLFILHIVGLHIAMADYGGWQNAHATFYGGGDASGTNGTQLYPTLITNAYSLLFILINFLYIHIYIRKMCMRRSHK